MGRGFIDKDPLVRGNGATGWSEKVVGPFSIAVFWFMAAFRASPWKVTRLVRSPAGADNHMTHEVFFFKTWNFELPLTVIPFRIRLFTAPELESVNHTIAVSIPPQHDFETHQSTKRRDELIERLDVR